MKPFNLKEALKGAPVVTRTGEKAENIAYFPAAHNERCRVVASVDGKLCIFDEEGGNYKDSLDLFMAVRKRTVWVNLYTTKRTFLESPSDRGNGVFHYYNTEEAANRAARRGRVGGRAFLLEIEE